MTLARVYGFIDRLPAQEPWKEVHDMKSDAVKDMVNQDADNAGIKGLLRRMLEAAEDCVAQQKEDVTDAVRSEILQEGAVNGFRKDIKDCIEALA